MQNDNSFLLSICIPTWNRAAVLKNTVTALTNSRSFADGKVEIVISDNASDDETMFTGSGFVRKFEEKIRYWRHETPIDPHFNFQHALEMGKGKFVKLHVDYLYYKPGELDRLIAFLENAAPDDHIFTGGEFESSTPVTVTDLAGVLKYTSFNITSINNLLLRRSLYHTLQDPFRAWQTYFPQVDILLRLLKQEKKAVILPILHSVRQPVLNNRNNAMIFANYLDMLKSEADNNALPRPVFNREKKKLLFNYLIPYHFDFFHQYNVSRRPLPFLPHCRHFKHEWYFVPALLWIGFMWFCSNVIPLHQLAGKLKRKLFLPQK